MVMSLELEQNINEKEGGLHRGRNQPGISGKVGVGGL